jgi:hypothetical protein
MSLTPKLRLGSKLIVVTFGIIIFLSLFSSCFN